MRNPIQVQVGEYRPTAYFDAGNNEYRRGTRVIVEADRSSEFGRVVSGASRVPEGERPPVIVGRVLRRVTDGDLRQIDNNRNKAREALHVCISRVSEMKLEMKMLAAEYSFDSTKIIFYFTAEGRVDFRGLVKDLAKTFRVRIELKQVGVRDRAKMIDGYGVCGQRLCCANFIKDFSQLSIKMAKEQALPLNPSKISGICGRIKCCMAYEYQVYRELNKGLPKMGARIQIPEGRGRVINLDILKRLVCVDMGEGKIIKVTVPKDEKILADNRPPAPPSGPKPAEGQGRPPRRPHFGDRRPPQGRS